MNKLKKMLYDADPSANAKNKEAVVKRFISHAEEFESQPKRISYKWMRPAIAVATIAIMVPVIAFAFGGNFIWRQLEVVEGGENVHYVEVLEEALDDGTTVSTGVIGMSVEPGYTGPITAVIDGEKVVVRDPNFFYDLDEALSLLEVDNPMLPAYIPEGYVFAYAEITIDPTRHPDHELAAKQLYIFYSNGEKELYFSITKPSRPEYLILSQWSDTFKDLEVNDNECRIGRGSMEMIVGDNLYFIGFSFTDDELVKIAESLQPVNP